MMHSSERPITVADEERKQVVALDRLLERALDVTLQATLDGRSVMVPATVRDAMRVLVHSLATTGAAMVVPAERLLRTQAAADILNVSRPYLTKLLDRGIIPYHRVGNQRRVRLEDVLAYKARRDADRSATLDDIIAASQEYGLYDQT